MLAQFSSLEVEIVWKLVFVKQLEFNNGEMLASSVDTELPTCPVCLERLDQEISGVITTVGFSLECLPSSKIKQDAVYITRMPFSSL